FSLQIADLKKNSSSNLQSEISNLKSRCAAPLPHPDADQMQTLGRQAMDWVVRHLATLPDQAVGHTGTRAELEALLRCPPPESGRDFAPVLRDCGEKVASHAFRPGHPRS